MILSDLQLVLLFVFDTRIFAYLSSQDWLWGSRNILSHRCPGVKRLGREANHSPATSAEIKKISGYTLTPHTPSWRSAYLSTRTTLFASSIILILFTFHRAIRNRMTASVVPALPKKKKKKNVVGLERGPLSLVSTTEELLDR
jgi:hypothetical protein